MSRRTARADLPPDPAALIRAMRVTREAMTGMLSKVKPMGPVYHAGAMVIAAIDAMATLLTGQPYYFSFEGSCATDQQRREAEERKVIEAGEREWPE